MSTLFELVDDMEQLHDMATDPDCDPQVLDDTLEGIIGAIEVKAGGNVRANSLTRLLAERPELSAVRYSILPYKNMMLASFKRR